MILRKMSRKVEVSSRNVTEIYLSLFLETKDTVKSKDDERYAGALERLVEFSGVTDDTVGREEILEKLVDVTVDFRIEPQPCTQNLG